MTRSILFVLAALCFDRATAQPVDFVQDVRPLLDSRCIQCHGRGKASGGFSLETRASLLRGGDSGAAIQIGNGAGSLLIELVSGLNPGSVMPQKGTRLSLEEVSLLRAWIDEGAPWPEEIAFSKPPPLNLKPRRPELPPGTPEENPIDRILRPYYEAHSYQPPVPVDDRTFARRAHMDVTGLLPSAAELKAFVSDSASDKRERLVRRLLEDRRRYAEHWMTFWNDLLRNDYAGTGYIDNGRKQITAWLYRALYDNLPFDQFVTELVAPHEASSGFTKGIVWRGVVNASQTPEMQVSQNLSQVFLGVNLKCASCHDSFINDWRLADAYGLASIYADEPLEMFRCDKPTGRPALMQFLYPELGSVDASAPKQQRLEQLAALMTSPENGRLSRTIVNRLWSRFLGRALVEPVDDMEQPAWNQDLLDYLAEDLAAHGFDLKQTIHRILTSQAYQLPSVLSEPGQTEFVFRGPAVRRLSAEQFVDAARSITGAWPALPSPKAELPLLEEAVPVRAAHWIWNDPGAAALAPPGPVWFRKKVILPDAEFTASAVVTCDNRFQMFVNGHEVRRGGDFKKPEVVPLTEHLRPGVNQISILATNDPSSANARGGAAANPAGLFFHGEVRIQGPRSAEGTVGIVSDESWLCSATEEEGWTAEAFEDASWGRAANLGPVNASPWALQKEIESRLAAIRFQGETRAALQTADPLTAALGRPNREQVVTVRASDATTLQALELTNGGTLSSLLKEGAKELLESGNEPRRLIAPLFERALGRPPTGPELDLCHEMIRTSTPREAVEDLLWTMLMHPEFQLLY